MGNWLVPNRACVFRSLWLSTHTLMLLLLLLFAQSLLTRHRMCSLYGSVLCVVRSVCFLFIFSLQLLFLFLIANYTYTRTHTTNLNIFLSLSPLFIHKFALIFQYLNCNWCKPQISVGKCELEEKKEKSEQTNERGTRAHTSDAWKWRSNNPTFLMLRRLLLRYILHSYLH